MIVRMPQARVFNVRGNVPQLFVLAFPFIMGSETLTDSSARIRAHELITQKDSIEHEIKEQEQILEGVILRLTRE